MTLKIEAGRHYKTRDGRKVRIYATDAGGEFAIHGAFQCPNGGRWRSESWRTSGVGESSNSYSSSDIVSEWREPVKVSGWVNVYPGGRAIGGVHATRETATACDDSMSEVAPKRIACVYVSGTEGVEPEEGEG